MNVNIPISGASDIIVLLIVAVFLAAGIRVFIGFWKKPKRKSTEGYEASGDETGGDAPAGENGGNA